MKCERCGKEHDGSFGSGRFCCRPCANSRGPRSLETKRKISETISGGKLYIERNLKCLNCGTVLEKPKKYCCKQCQIDYQHNQYIKKWKSGEIDGSKSNGNSVSGYVRRYLWRKYNNKCSRCGWDTPNPITGKPILEIEHIDGNYKNNKEENLDLICPNCHSLTPTYKALNYGKAGDRHKYFGHKN